MNTNYILYTGYFHFLKPENEKLTETHCFYTKYAELTAQEFFNLWYENTRKYIPKEIPIHILGPDKPNLENKENIKSLLEYENLGHLGDLLSKNKTGFLCGYTASAVYGMMDAYLRGKDFLYKEQDCLAFGDYIGEIYRIINDCNNYGVLVGPNQTQPCSTALHFIKRNSIPYAINKICSTPDIYSIPENKYSEMPNLGKLTFGYDRDRPFNVKDKIFYVQQIKTQELQILKDEKLI
jgi:hypothetical protein